MLRTLNFRPSTRIPSAVNSTPSTTCCIRTMESSGVLLRLLCIGVLCVTCRGQASQEVSAEDFGAQNSATATERELVDAMEALLVKMESRLPSTEKRGMIPPCGVGQRCALRHGPHIGKLCDCGRVSSCNSFLLKCL
ncbi:cocaine- and amphetamine-regulated transcript protein [Esox lucius]|uniref:Uncharacterized protein n=1 Tax=Esox lucius TaxID=8010 RepID=A0A3P8XA06_ESOLU|nr:cocaine- and amphetamine-regulated transcript protein [Esox lucius]